MENTENVQATPQAEPRSDTAVGSNPLLAALGEWERMAYKNERAFLKRFCHDAWILTHVSWGSENMKFVYILNTGQHIADSAPITYWLDFAANAKRSDKLCHGVAERKT
jgi:hypothetical protein